MTHLFIEILSEEIPARMQNKAAADFKRLILEGLEQEGLSYSDATILVSPRRLALKIDDLPHEKPSQTTEKKGPRVDAPEKAIQGFLASTGLTLEQCKRRSLSKGDFLFAVIQEPSQLTRDILPAIIEKAIKSIPWPQSMRWGSGTETWIRPVHNLILLFGEDPLELTVSFGDPNDAITAGSTRVGHTLTSPRTFSVASFDDYVEKLERSHVMVDQDQRRDYILKEARRFAKEKGFSLKEDPALLEEVTGLVEWPVVLMGKIDDAFMELPKEILITSMKVHQRYFSLEDKEGNLAPYFIFVANIEACDSGKTIIAGNERVLGARLSDAQFFWSQDCKKSLESLRPRLEKITFHEDLGTVYAKVDRLVSLCESLCQSLGKSSEETKDLALAARLCKADLVTEMVYEFPELQGIMGGYYAEAEGQSKTTAHAIAEHYSPKGVSDNLPSTNAGSLLSLADRLDTLVGFFAVGLRPTGSKDPFALRRAILGIIRLQEQGIDLTFDDLILIALACYKPLLEESSKALPHEEILSTLKAFYLERLKIYWKERGLSSNTMNATFATNSTKLPLRIVKDRIQALEDFLNQDDQKGQDLLAVYKRASNILQAEQKKDGGLPSAESVDPALFNQDEETALWKALQQAEQTALPALEKQSFQEAYKTLSTLKPSLDAYFDHVTVNAEDATLRHNRLATLQSFQALLKNVADFSKI